jgi:hypothetical protein
MVFRGPDRDHCAVQALLWQPQPQGRDGDVQGRPLGNLNRSPTKGPFRPLFFYGLFGRALQFDDVRTNGRRVFQHLKPIAPPLKDAFAFLKAW